MPRSVRRSANIHINTIATTTTATTINTIQYKAVENKSDAKCRTFRNKLSRNQIAKDNEINIISAQVQLVKITNECPKCSGNHRLTGARHLPQ